MRSAKGGLRCSPGRGVTGRHSACSWKGAFLPCVVLTLATAGRRALPQHGERRGGSVPVRQMLVPWGAGNHRGPCAPCTGSGASPPGLAAGAPCVSRAPARLLPEPAGFQPELGFPESALHVASSSFKPRELQPPEAWWVLPPNWAPAEILFLGGMLLRSPGERCASALQRPLPSAPLPPPGP